MENILITGAGSGIGKALKEKCLKEGHIVYAFDILEMERTDNLHPFKVDICDESSIENVRKKFEKENIKLDIIYNIAGIHKMASLVETDYETIKKVIDVNLLGTILVNRTFHQFLKNDGRIIIITSEVASFDPMPFNGLYSISKSSLDIYAQALRQELNLIGQKVITFRPGAVETPLCSSSLIETENLVNNTSLYREQSSKFLKLVSMFMGKPIPVDEMANFIYRKSMKEHPRIIYKKHQNLGLVLLNVLPKRWQCRIIKTILNH